MISSNRIYDADLDGEEEDSLHDKKEGENKLGQAEVLKWRKQFANNQAGAAPKKQSTQSNLVEHRRQSSMLHVKQLKALRKEGVIDPHEFLKLCKLDDLAFNEVQRVEEYDFDIFKVRRSTKGREMLVVVPFLL